MQKERFHKYSKFIRIHSRVTSSRSRGGSAFLSKMLDNAWAVVQVGLNIFYYFSIARPIACSSFVFTRKYSRGSVAIVAKLFANGLISFLEAILVSDSLKLLVSVEKDAVLLAGAERFICLFQTRSCVSRVRIARNRIFERRVLRARGR